MTLKGLDTQEDCIKAISSESLIFDIKNKAFLEDIENLLLQYFQAFSNDLNRIEFDNFSVEFWFDAGQLIIYPEKDLLDRKPFESEYDLDRLDPYFYLVCEEYRIYFDDLISRKVSDQVSEKEAISKTNDVIDCVSKAIKNINDENNLLKMLGRPKLEIRYFGVTKEELLAKEILVK